MKNPQHYVCCIAKRVVLSCVLLMIVCTTHAADIFSGSKDIIVDTVGSDSNLYFALMVVGVVVAALTGFLTKNWPAAIGSFIVGVIFINTAMNFVGL
jgi:type IV conjugative transfer system pilin TraA